MVLATVLNRRFGSGSVSQLNCCQIGSPGCQYTRTINSGTVQCKSPNLSELGGLSSGHAAGPSVDSYNALVFAVRWLYVIKIMHLAASNLFLHVLQCAILIILESVFFLSYDIFLPRKVVTSAVISSYIRAMPWLPIIQDQKLLTVSWHSLPWWGNIYMLYCFQ